MKMKEQMSSIIVKQDNYSTGEQDQGISMDTGAACRIP